MDSASQQATIVLASLAESASRGRALAQGFQAMPEVQTATFDFDCHRNHSHHAFDRGSPYVFGWDVEVVLRGGVSAIWWSLDATWDNVRWIVESKVEAAGDPRPVTVKRFPDRHAETADEFARQLDAATAELVNSANLIETQL